MTTPAVPDGGTHYLQGTLVPSPADTIPAGDVRLHDFCNVMRDVVRAAGPFRNETLLDEAIASVDEFERHLLSTSRERVAKETDLAPREDVSQRIPPQVGTAVVPAAGAGLDYNRLAAAIIAAQRQADESGRNDEPVEGEAQ